jgi:hypothetical protein
MGEFADFFYKWERDLHNQSDALVRQVALGVMESLVEKSPVGDPSLWAPKSLPPPPGYEGGKFKANWQYGLDKVNELTTDDIDPTGQISIDQIGLMPDKASGHIHYITNSLPYARVLEDGEHSSQVPPHGMVGLTVVEFEDIVNKSVARIRK